MCLPVIYPFDDQDVNERPALHNRSVLHLPNTTSRRMFFRVIAASVTPRSSRVIFSNCPVHSDVSTALSNPFLVHRVQNTPLLAARALAITTW